MRWRWWQFVLLAVAHPVEGWCYLLVGRCPAWVTAFHLWVFDRAYRD